MSEQPPPVPNNRPAIAGLVIADIQQRMLLGMERYGVPLQAHNGRDALVDAYEEQLDHVKYLRQEIEERADHRAEGAAEEASLTIAYLERVGFHGLADDFRAGLHRKTQPAPPFDDAADLDAETEAM
jgi:hypothetical protein